MTSAKEGPRAGTKGRGWGKSALWGRKRKTRWPGQRRRTLIRESRRIKGAGRKDGRKKHENKNKHVESAGCKRICFVIYSNAENNLVKTAWEIYIRCLFHEKWKKIKFSVRSECARLSRFSANKRRCERREISIVHSSKEHKLVEKKKLENHEEYIKKKSMPGQCITKLTLMDLLG